MKRYWNYNRATSLWYKWHHHICGRLHFKHTPSGLAFRKGKLAKLLYKLQLPICKWLDDWSHSKPDA